MRVLFVSIYDPCIPGGPNIHLYSLSRELSTLGCEVHILTPGSNTMDKVVDGFQIHYIKSRFFGHVFMFSLFSVTKINELCKEYKIDIVHGQSPSSAGYALLRGNKSPFIVTLHGTSFGEMISCIKTPISLVTQFILRNALFVQPLTAFLTNLEYRGADKVIAVSKYIAHEAARFYRLPKDKIVTVYNGVDLPDPPIKEKSVDHMILSVGRLIWRKGFKYLIDAMPHVLAEYPDARLLLVGNGPYGSFLKEYIRKLKVESSVKLLGKVTTDKLWSLYAKASVYVQPSLYEPFGITILEAMSMRTPVVTTRVGGIPEVIRNGKEGLLVQPRNGLDLAKAIMKLFSDVSYARKLGDRARSRVQREFTWERSAQKTLSMYEDLL